MSDYYPVENILKKRVRNGRVEYFLKWEGHESVHNSWVRIENMECPDLLRDFEISRFGKIVGISAKTGEIRYGIQMHDNPTIELVASDIAVEKWPTEVIKYLESLIHFEMPVESTHLLNGIEINQTAAVGEPIEILACTDQADALKYLCAWPGDQETRKVVTSDDAGRVFPRMVVSFLEGKLNLLHGDVSSFKDRFRRKTRSFTQWVIRENVCFDPKVNLFRNVDLDRHVLNQPRPQPINQRRATHVQPGNRSKKIDQRRATGPVTLKNITSVPFGARGRKRGTNSLLFIGLQVNPDGKTTQSSGSVGSAGNFARRAIPVSSTSNHSSGPVVPADDSTARPDPTLSSTLLPPTSSGSRDIQPPAFDFSDDSITFDMDSLDKTIGHLHYSDSD